MFCTDCGTSNQEDAKVCVQCGESLAEPGIKRRPFIERVLRKTSFLQTLSGFPFDKSATSKIPRFLYALSILYAALLAFLYIAIGFSVSKALGLFMIVIGTPLIFLLTAVYSRVLLQMFVVVSRIANHASEIAKKSDSKDGIQWNI
jgi:hypothetical protein